MKKVFLALAVVTVALVACNNEGEKKVDEVKTDSPKVETPVTTPDTNKTATPDTNKTATPAAAPVKDTAAKK